jgi:hypothetical protein
VGHVAQEDVDDLIHRREVHAVEPTRPPSEHCLIASTKICWLSRSERLFLCAMMIHGALRHYLKL